MPISVPCEEEKITFGFTSEAVRSIMIFTDFIVFALFTYCLHWIFNLYKYLTQQCQK